MEMDDPAIVDLIELVSAAQKQFDWAVAYHEAWKPMAFDAELHKRMGAYSVDRDHPFRSIAITDSGDRDHDVHHA